MMMVPGASLGAVVDDLAAEIRGSLGLILGAWHPARPAPAAAAQRCKQGRKDWLMRWWRTWRRRRQLRSQRQLIRREVFMTHPDVVSSSQQVADKVQKFRRINWLTPGNHLAPG